MKHILWLGPRESDIAGQNFNFCGSITIFGSGIGTNRAYSKDIHMRINHNDPDCVPDEYYNNEIENWIEKYPDIKLFYYNSLHSRSLRACYRDLVIGCNSLSSLELLDSKCEMRQIASRHIPVVPYYKIDNPKQLAGAVSGLDEGAVYILQENHASGGIGTHVVNKRNLKSFLATCRPERTYFASPYMENSTSVNIHCIIFEEKTVVLPGSVQLVKPVNDRLIYMGADFIAYQSLPFHVRETINDHGRRFCSILRKIGYRGVLGIDFLVYDQEPHFVEVNARFQASTALLNKTLAENNLPSMQELHLLAFSESDCCLNEDLESLKVPYSMASYTTENYKKDCDAFERIKAYEAAEIVLDGYTPSDTVSKGAHLFQAIFHTNLCDRNPDGGVWIYENLFDIEDFFSAEIYNKNPLHVKISLLNQGVVFTKETERYLSRQGEIRQAVFSAVDLTVLNGLQVNCPKDVKFVDLSPWKIDLDKNDNLMLYYRNCEISDVRLDMVDPFSRGVTHSGIPYRNISFWATDRMRIHHTISCLFKQQNVGCCFCELTKQESACKLEDIYEVIDFYLERDDTFRHFLIGGGSEPLDEEEKRITEIVKHIRSRSQKPIYVMCLPPKNLSVLKAWHDAGVTEVAFNIELFDRKTAKQLMPGKGSIPLQQYLTALEASTQLWGKDGNVRTLFIIGLESTDSLLRGIEEVASCGIMPILSVFRALNGTDTEDFVPPSNAWLLDIFKSGEEICRRYQLHLGPSCSACQNNTLSLPFHMLH